MKQDDFSQAFISDVIAMAWADDVPFETIKLDTGLSEKEVIRIMRTNLKYSSFSLWRKRVSGRKLKHEKKSTNILEDEPLEEEKNA